MRPPFLLAALLAAWCADAIPINDLLNASTLISPACRASIRAIPPGPLSGWQEAALASGDLDMSRNVLFRKYLMMRDTWELVGGVAVSDVGNFDACITLAQQKRGRYHYCDMQTPLGPFIRWGACLPRGCTGADVSRILLPPNLGIELTSRCGNTWPRNHLAERIFGGVIVGLMALALLATIFHVASEYAYRTGKKTDTEDVAVTASRSVEPDVLPVAQGPPRSVQEIEMLPALHPLQKHAHRSSASLSNSDSSVDLAAARAQPSPGLQRFARSMVPSAKAQGGLLWRMFMCFSLLGSVRALFSPRRGSFRFLDGIRAISLLYIVLGNAFLHPLTMVGFSNVDWLYTKWVHRPSATLVSSSLFAIATFLFLSGFLAVTLFAKHLVALREYLGASVSNRAFAGSIPWLFVHRYLRLIPAYAFIVALYLIFGPYLTEGPMTSQLEADTRNCRSKWWLNALFVSNFHIRNPFDMCYPASWYLNVDLQLWITTPFFVLIGVNYPRIAYAVGLGLVLAAIGYTAYKSVTLNLSMNLLDQPDYLAYEATYYMKPLNRLPSYYIGCILGLLWVHEGERIKAVVKKGGARVTYLLIGTTLVCAFLLAVSIFGTKDIMSTLDEAWSRADMASFITLSEPAWAIGLSLMVILLLLRLGGPILTLLEAPLFLVLSRLTFCAYLIHPAILSIWTSTVINPVRLTDLGLYLITFGTAVMAYLLAAAVFLLVEKPFADLCRLLLRVLRHDDMGAYLMAVEDSKGQIGEEGWPKKRLSNSYGRKQGDDDSACGPYGEDTLSADGEELKIEQMESARVEKPQVERPRVEKPRVEKPRVEKPQVEKTRIEKARIEKPWNGKALVEKPKVEKPQVEQPKLEIPKEPVSRDLDYLTVGRI